MPSIGTYRQPDEAIVPIPAFLKTVATPCDADPRLWTGGDTMLTELRNARAKAGCAECLHRLLCAGWAFEMEQFHTWGGFTEAERRALKRYAPELIEEVTMIVRGLTRVRVEGVSLAPGKEVDVAPELAKLLIERNFAVPVSAPELRATLVKVGNATLDRMADVVSEALAAEEGTQDDDPEDDDEFDSGDDVDE